MVERLRNRPTADLIVIFLAGMIGIAVLAGVVGLIVLKVAQPDENINSSVKVIGDILTVALGAVVGFVGGRAVGANEANQEDSGPQEES